MHAFVTGSTSLLGYNLVHMLRAEGHRVTALARSPRPASDALVKSGARVVFGDLLNVEGFADALDGCDVLFHSAAMSQDYYYYPGNHWPRLQATNVRAAVRLLIEAEKRGLDKVVHVSTSGIVGMHPDGSPGDESTPIHPVMARNLYYQSKLRAEEAIREFLDRHRLPVTLIQPGTIFGPGDVTPTTTGQLVLNFLQRRVPFSVDAGILVVDVRDVAQAMINAVERGGRGERYLVAGRFYTIDEILQTLSELTGIPAPRQQVPQSLMLAYAQAAEWWAALTGGRALASVKGAEVAYVKLRLSSQKAIFQLGVTFRSLAETLRDEVEWYRTHPVA